ncbi:MAG: non-canonical purine pyrophosphatase [Devosia sp.]|uniref:RdgB/HAM1 family non-canonical purine NTP pyrophosphatase n=1 Tax=Devosia sp. TaxID=1871048 RepID=UPI00261CBF43|nr:RdgB/HAM1 family non-canonical purine NTP pyrophosphatase [Devosia sp.]MDB5530771.1 non-canonical purine pyrophosphatase [Devosia sp.]
MSALLRLRDGDRLVLATHNKGKLKEFQELFEPFGLELISAGELGLPEPEETGTTFAENARLKAHASAQGSGMIALSDDSGLCVDALGGDPGVYTADWAGVPRDFSHAMKRVEDALQAANATSPSQRKAHFMATLCLAHPDGRDWLFEGQCNGTMVWPPRGEQGHGYDPAFMPDGYDITFGQMAAEAKHSWTPGETGLSHRARAFAKFVEQAIERE